MGIPWTSGDVLNASDLNDATNWQWLPAQNFTAALGVSFSFGVFGSWSSVAQAWSLPDGNNELVLANMIAPATGNLKFDMYFQGGGSGNFELLIDSGGGKTPGTPGDDVFNLTLFSTMVVPSYNGLGIATTGSSMSVAKGDLVQILAGRRGNAAADTSTNICFFFGVKAYYV